MRSPKEVIRLLQGIRMMSLGEKRGILMDNKNENRFPLRLDDVTRWKIESWYKKDDCQSRNEFVVKAVNFYADYLAGQVNGVLPVAIQSAIDGRLGMFEDRLAQLLYKLAVETDMGSSAVLDCIQVDAERLGYDHAPQWRNLIRAHRNEIAAAMNIPPQDFRWYAAFHDEGGHPHIHMMSGSAKPGQAYLSRDGIHKIKSALTNDIFKQELLHTYEQKSSSKEELVRRAREEMKALAQEMHISLGNHPEAESLMMTLVAQLESVTGKKKYGYLPKAVKKTVDEVVNQMEQLPGIDECYQVWWALQCQIEDFYSEKERRRPPLSEQKEFRSIKNAVIQEAENIRMGKVTFEDEGMEEPTEFPGLSYDCWELWMVTQDDTAPMADRDEAAAQLMGMAENCDPDAQYLIGRLYRDGPVLIPDSVKTQLTIQKSVI